MQRVHLVECPRDAIQGWPRPISTEEKLHYYRTLLAVGFDTLDLGSFVSPRAMPQMADTGEVISRLTDEGLAMGRTRLLVIVGNARGAQDATRYAAIDDVGFPLSLSDTFQRRNTGVGLEGAWERVSEIQEQLAGSGKRLVVYLSMGFGNPYGDAWSPALLSEFSGRLVEEFHVDTIALSDTVGTAQPDTIRSAIAHLIPRYPGVSFGAHLHARASEVWEKAKAALEGGCLRLDGAMGGIGGCPMAQDDLVGNLATETLVMGLEEAGIWSVENRRAWEEAQRLAASLFG